MSGASGRWRRSVSWGAIVGKGAGVATAGETRETVTVDRRSLIGLLSGLGAVILALVGLGVWTWLTAGQVGQIKAVLCGQHVVPISDGKVAASQEKRLVSLCGVRVTRGPRGEVGFVGPRGPIGLTGATGARGPRGARGERGPAGASARERVLRGATGATGARGPAGATGAQGPPGPAGPPSANGGGGGTGARGPAGPPGERGPAGPRGPSGITGPIGPVGPSVPISEVVSQVCARLPVRLCK